MGAIASMTTREKPPVTLAVESNHLNDNTNRPISSTSQVLVLADVLLCGMYGSAGSTSMVQKGKFAASAVAFCRSALKSVDLPTLGSPTMPV